MCPCNYLNLSLGFRFPLARELLCRYLAPKMRGSIGNFNVLTSVREATVSPGFSLTNSRKIDTLSHSKASKQKNESLDCVMVMRFRKLLRFATIKQTFQRVGGGA